MDKKKEAEFKVLPQGEIVDAYKRVMEEGSSSKETMFMYFLLSFFFSFFLKRKGVVCKCKNN